MKNNNREELVEVLSVVISTIVSFHKVSINSNFENAIYSLMGIGLSSRFALAGTFNYFSGVSRKDMDDIFDAAFKRASKKYDELENPENALAIKHFIIVIAQMMSIINTTEIAEIITKMRPAIFDEDQINIEA